MFRKMMIMSMLAVGCLNWQENPTHEYKIYIDPSFTDDQANQIIASFTEWQVKTGNFVKFSGTTLENDVDGINVYPTTLQQLDKNDGILGETWSNGVSSKIEIALDANDISQISLHEIGHALGCNHIQGVGTIMFPNRSKAGYSVSCADVYEMCRHWDNCDPNQMPACLEQ